MTTTERDVEIMNELNELADATQDELDALHAFLRRGQENVPSSTRLREFADDGDEYKAKLFVYGRALNAFNRHGLTVGLAQLVRSTVTNFGPSSTPAERQAAFEALRQVAAMIIG